MGAWKHNLNEMRDAQKKENASANRATQQQRKLMIYTLIALCITLLMICYSFYRNSYSTKYVYILAVVVVLIFATIAMFTYLDNTANSNYFNTTYTTTVRRVDLSSIEDKIDFLAINFKNPSSSKIDEDKIYKIVEEGFKANLQESFMRSLEEKYSEIIINEIHYKDISEEITRSKNRILNEISSLNKRGNLNLVIGSLTTIVSVGVLFSSFLYSLTVIKIDEILIHFLPRISIVLFAEIFAFFFLRLYRNSLIDIKYYQNELTNIESKGLALKAAILMKDKDLYNNIITDFSKIERNSIIKNDESTNNIILNKNESDKDKSYSDSLKSLTEVVEKLIKGKN